MSPAARANDYNTAIPLGVNAVAQVIADRRRRDFDTDPDVCIPIMRNRVETQVHLSFWQVVIGGGVVLIILIFLDKHGECRDGFFSS